MKRLLHPWVFAFAILFLFIYKLILLEIDELFPKAYEIGDLFYEAVLAYFSGYIFFLLVEYMPNRRDKKIVYLYIDKKRNQLIANVNTLVNHLITEIDVVSNSTPKDPSAAARMILARDINKGHIDQRNMTQDNFNRIMGIIHDQTKSPVSQYQTC